MGLDMTGVEVVYAAERPDDRHDYAEKLFQRRARRGLTLAEAQWNLYKPIYFALSMVEEGQADAIVAGIEANYAEILRPALQVIGAKGDMRVAGLYMLAFRNRHLVFLADTTVNIAPSAETLRDIALQTASFVRDLGIPPRVAMVSFSNFGSAPHDESRRVAEAVQLVREADPELEIDGEMQADTAVDPVALREVYPFTHLTGPANILVFPRPFGRQRRIQASGAPGGRGRDRSHPAGHGQAGAHRRAGMRSAGHREPVGRRDRGLAGSRAPRESVAALFPRSKK